MRQSGDGLTDDSRLLRAATAFVVCINIKRLPGQSAMAVLSSPGLTVSL